MKLVGIISDTHGRLSIKALAAVAECDHIIHAGDIGDPGILAELAQYAPVTAVLGNNDYPEYGAEVGLYACVRIEGVAFVVGHRPRDTYRALAQRDVYEARKDEPCVAVHGHVHYPVLLQGEEAAPADMLICPGSVSLPRCGSQASVAFVQVDAGRILDARVEGIA